MFFEHDGKFYPLSGILSIEVQERRLGYCETILKLVDDNRQIKIEGRDIGWELRFASASIIPAPPGWTALVTYENFYETENKHLEPHIDHRPIVAFAIFPGYSHLVPVCVEIVEEDKYAIMGPDGKVDEPHSSIYESIGDFEKAKRREYLARRSASNVD